ncbi:hypothetical protein [Peribacillus deserti]|uniref:Uncharacterized protein n=1 Tax=Peribacillus deserti TaxID=673318 RepID=A0A2N5M7I9_9BACI|nr:hypothetical protein [Peribacillus deserti]PLT30321.1 hypothetical protein CUU66_08250 [Peribacillus deserti]
MVELRTAFSLHLPIIGGSTLPVDCPTYAWLTKAVMLLSSYQESAFLVVDEEIQKASHYKASFLKNEAEKHRSPLFFVSSSELPSSRHKPISP